MSTLSVSAATLSERHSDLTQRLILESAVQVLEQGSVADLTVRAVASRANISERTVFRYFADREAFLDAIAAEVIRRLDMPPHPESIDQLLQMPEQLYACFEPKPQLVKAALHSELFDRIRGAPAQQRWVAIARLIDRHAPRSDGHLRKLTAANIRFYLSATTWHYYRFYFGFGPEETVECARQAIRQSLDGLRDQPPRRKRR